LKHRRKSPVHKTTVHKTTLVLLVIVVATISTTSTWIFLTYSIGTSTSPKHSANQQIESFAGLNATWLYETSSQGVVIVQGVQTTVAPYGSNVFPILGSGFVINQDGANYVISNFHVVDGTSNLTVTFYDGNAYAAKVVGDDPYSDLAVLSVSGAGGSEFHPLSLASSGSLVVGEPILAIGNPYGLASSVTVGIISQRGRTIQESAAGNFSIGDMIQFSAPINPGNSGGPLLNREGKVIGVTTAVVTDSQGVGFAIPSDTVSRELPYLIRTGRYDLHPYLGIVATDMNYQLAKALGTNVTYGVLVEKVILGGPADAAGIRGGNKTITILGQKYIIGGDIIISINGGRILTKEDLATYLEENATSGEKVQVGVVRSGMVTFISLALGTRPPPPP
jgi:S1-C subfamily serine protease